MNTKNDELHVLTEVGVFGDLDIDDPTAKKVKRKKTDNDDIEGMINDAIEKNLKGLENI